MKSLFNSTQEEHENYRTPFIEEDDLLWHPIPITTWTQHTQYCWALEIHWLTRLFVAQAVRLKVEDCAIILTIITKVKKEIGEIKEVFHNLGRKFGVCLFPIPEATPAHPVSNATPLDNIPATPKSAA